MAEWRYLGFVDLVLEPAGFCHARGDKARKQSIHIAPYRLRSVQYRRVLFMNILDPSANAGTDTMIDPENAVVGKVIQPSSCCGQEE